MNRRKFLGSLAVIPLLSLKDFEGKDVLTEKVRIDRSEYTYQDQFKKDVLCRKISYDFSGVDQNILKECSDIAFNDDFEEPVSYYDFFTAYIEKVCKDNQVMKEIAEKGFCVEYINYRYSTLGISCIEVV